MKNWGNIYLYLLQYQTFLGHQLKNDQQNLTVCIEDSLDFCNRLIDRLIDR